MRFAALLLTLSALVAEVAHGSGQERVRAPGVRPTVFVVEVEPARVRAVRWAAPDAGDEVAVEAAAAHVRRRLAAMEREARITVDGKRLEIALPLVQPRDRELFASWVAGIGLCELMFVAESDPAAGIDLDAETAKLEAWRALHPAEPLESFHAAEPAAHARILWAETGFGDTPGPPMALLLPARPEDCFGAGDFASAGATNDSYGYPGIAVELVEPRADDFARLTGTAVGRRLAFVLEGRVRSTPMLSQALRKEFLVEGRFAAEEAQRLAKSIAAREGPLRLVETR